MEVNIEQIRDYSEELIDAVNKLLKQLNDSAISLTEENIRTIITSSANRLFVARESGSKKIVGMLTLVVFRIPFAKKALLEDVVVDRDYRGKGIGTKLILTATEQARKEKALYLDFTSNPNRIEANKFYQRLGFEKRDTNVYRMKLQ